MESVNIFLFHILANASWHNLFFDTLAVFFSQYFLYILLPLSLLIPCILFLRISGLYKKWTMLRIFCAYFCTLLFTYAIVEIVKGFTMEQRPSELLGTIPLLPYGALDSFPSLHSAFAFALAATTGLWSKKWGTFLYVAATFVALSRVYAGVHFPLDVLAGAVIGAGIGLIFRYIFNTYFKNE